MARIASATVNSDTSAGPQVSPAVYTWPVGYSDWICTVLPRYGLCAALIACGSPGPMQSSGPSVPVVNPPPPNSSGEAMDLRVSLQRMVLGQNVETELAVHSKSGHNADALEMVVRAHQEQLAACLPPETISPKHSTMSGALTLHIELNARGGVLGGSTSPGPGQEGVSRIAACVLDAARGWLFPARARGGRTILIIPFVIAR
ncbi:MAG: hypothetical protein GY811_19820 [Myxococcales bacterium]|nr:hypothetical protein [Myxococcales bacterium]